MSFPYQPHTTISVMDDLPDKFATGILDQNGHMILRQEVKDPIGFIWPKESQEVKKYNE